MPTNTTQSGTTIKAWEAPDPTAGGELALYIQQLSTPDAFIAAAR